MSRWINYQREKPQHDMCCIVTNSKYGFVVFQAIYHKNYDTFTKDDVNDRRVTPLDVTHYFEMPPYPTGHE